MDRKLIAACALTLGIAAQPAAAQLAPLSEPNYSLAKSEAILGGTSKLAALLAQQSGQRAPASMFSSPVPQPASLGTASLRSPVPALLHRSVSDDRPDVFGTVALAVPHTPLDRRWRRVQNVQATGSSATWAGALRSRDEADRIDAINRFVNARVTFIDDIRQYRSADVWQTASDTLRRGRGDCEDYAIAKLQLLRAAGFAADDLYLVIAKDLVRRADHAVLVVRSEGRMLLLDNATDRITDATAYQDYRPILSYAASGRSWTHGYRREAAPINVAAGPSGLTAAAASVASTALALR
jgi:predicted transglutaminase-like cysteine proteinase